MKYPLEENGSDYQKYSEADQGLLQHPRRSAL